MFVYGETSQKTKGLSENIKENVKDVGTKNKKKVVKQKSNAYETRANKKNEESRT